MRLIVLVLLALGVLAGDVAAYPEFQFSTGATRCAECHFAPMGGGLINAYGRDEAASTISEAGDGRFLHGAIELPEWIALGGDVRVAGLGKHVRDGTEAAVFPMQADLYARVANGTWSVQGTFGVLETIRKPGSFTERLGSREHYAMVEAEDKAWYARAGRFLPAFGLRMPDHTVYVRRYTGQHAFEESYGLGAGFAKGSWEVHATLMTPLELHPVVGRHGWGGALMVERFNEASTASVILQARSQRVGDTIENWTGGAYKRWIEDADIWVAAEIDVGMTRVPDAPVITRIAAYATASYRPGKKWGAALGAHAYDGDVRIVDNDRIALDTRFAWFPRAHLEVAALVRGAVLARELARGDVFGFLQLHYYL